MSEATADPRLTGARAAPKRALRLTWSDPTFRAIVWQIVVVGAIVAIAWYLIGNTNRNLAARHIATGFGFLGRVAGIPIGESPIDYNPAVDTYGTALIIGILNTLRVAAVGIVLSTILGTLIGIGRLSRNWLLARLTGFYVETLRDIPLLLQLFFWYSILQALPPPRQAWHIGDLLYLSNRGVRFEELEWEPAYTWGLVGFIAGVICTVMWNRLARWRQEATGRRPPVWPIGLAMMVGLPLAIWDLLGAPFHPDVPVLRGFNFQGGGAISPEYFALLLGLVIYTAAYIAEIVRSGIQAVALGQWEAAGALGLRRGMVLRGSSCLRRWG